MTQPIGENQFISCPNPPPIPISLIRGVPVAKEVTSYKDTSIDEVETLMLNLISYLGSSLLAVSVAT